jgi:hypothetical protein
MHCRMKIDIAVYYKMELALILWNTFPFRIDLLRVGMRQSGKGEQAWGFPR